MSELQDLARRIAQCTDCPLSQGRTQAVPGEGNEQAAVLFIGEGPGFHEDRQGRPFVGAAGQFLDSLLTSVHLQRSDVFITNMVKCRPPNNRDPFPAEIEACGKHLDRQIELINPQVIVTLGRHSLAKFFPKESVSKVRGKARPWQGRVVYPLLHPASALYRQELRGVIEQDFQAIPALLKAHPPAPPPQESRPEAGQQLSFL